MTIDIPVSELIEYWSKRTDTVIGQATFDALERLRTAQPKGESGADASTIARCPHCGTDFTAPVSPATRDPTDTREFYELMQQYRHRPIQDQADVCEAYEAVREYIRKALRSPAACAASQETAALVRDLGRVASSIRSYDARMLDHDKDLAERDAQTVERAIAALRPAASQGETRTVLETAEQRLAALRAYVPEHMQAAYQLDREEILAALRLDESKAQMTEAERKLIVDALNYKALHHEDHDARFGTAEGFQGHKAAGQQCRSLAKRLGEK